MTTSVIRIGDDCISVMNRWRYDMKTESISDALRRMDRKLKEYGENGVRDPQ